MALTRRYKDLQGKSLWVAELGDTNFARVEQDRMCEPFSMEVVAF